MKLGISIAAGALMTSVSAASCFAQAVPVGATAFGSAAAPSFVTETIVWNGAHALPLETSPLSLLGRPAAAFTSEWAPLYRGAGGARLEQAHQDVRVGASFGAWWAGADLVSESSAFRGGESHWGFDAGAAPAQRGAVAAAIAQSRGAAAIAASVAADGRAGLAVEGRAMLAPAWSALVRASTTPRDGALDVRWQDEAIESSGRWNEQRALARIDASVAAVSIAATLEAFDRVPVRDRGRADGFEPHLTWRGATLAVSRTLGLVAVGAELRHGDGRQRIDVSRNGVPYAVAAGPVREDVAIASAAPRTAPWSARVWTGRSHDAARGSLALWPFDGVAAVAGTRYAAHTDLELRHAGIAIDGRAAERCGWDGGLAIWIVDPRGHYESWRGTLFALGRDDYGSDEFGAARAWLAGVRLARTQPLAWLRLRAELVQWAPVHVERPREAAVAVGGGDGGGGDATPHGAHSHTWGGTVIRMAVEVPARHSAR